MGISVHTDGLEAKIQGGMQAGKGRAKTGSEVQENSAEACEWHL